MHIALAFDAAFARYGMVTITSIAEHGIPTDGSVTWWLQPGADIPPAALDTVVRWAEKSGPVNLLHVPAELDALPRSSWKVMSSRISTAAYYRFLLPDMIPPTVERLLWLDSDLIVTGDLTGLWETDLRGTTMGAVIDRTCPRISGGGGVPGYDPDKYKIPFFGDYFNSGVLLMDQERCRAADLSGRCLAYVRDHAPKLRFAVQDAMNLAVDGEWLRLDQRWNDFDFRAYQDADPAERDPRVLHFAGPKKPWQDAFPDGEVKTLYRRYLDNLPALGVDG
jgi:lipopolysaccharide biosynthesis glycosyltransferase